MGNTEHGRASLSAFSQDEKMAGEKTEAVVVNNMFANAASATGEGS